MKSVIKLFIIGLLAFGLVGCSSSEVPPSPDSPGGVAGEYTVATEDVGEWANANVVGKIVPDRIILNAEKSEKDVRLSVADNAVWNSYFIYDIANEAWSSEVFSDTTYKDSGWILPLSGTEISVDDVVTKDQIGDYIVAFYTCSKDGAWDCHGGWQVEGYSVEVKTLEELGFTVGTYSTNTVEYSKIEIIAVGPSPYTEINLAMDSAANQFQIENATVEYIQDEGSSTALLTLTEENFEGEPIYLIGHFENSGIYELSFHGEARNYEDKTQMTTISGNIEVDLPDLPSNIGGSSLNQDTDKDGVLNLDDNCASVFNPGQEDMDEDGIGNACETSPNCVGTGTYSISVEGSCVNTDSLEIVTILESAGDATFGDLVPVSGEGCPCAAPPKAACTFPDPTADAYQSTSSGMTLSVGENDFDLTISGNNKDSCSNTLLTFVVKDGSRIGNFERQGLSLSETVTITATVN